MDSIVPQSASQGNPLPPVKYCPKCCEWLPLNEFNVHRRKKKQQSWCKRCNIKHQREIRYQMTKDQRYDIDLRRIFGITIEQYNDMLEAQGGVCAGCGEPETRIHPESKEIQHLSVDHNHETGEIRGLLCHGCNLAIGYMNEDAERIRALAFYAERCETQDFPSNGKVINPAKANRKYKGRVKPSTGGINADQGNREKIIQFNLFDQEP